MSNLSTNEKSNHSLEAALGYNQRGWSVIPIHSIRNGRCTCGQADCDKPGKHPTMPWKEFQTRHATRAEVRSWFKRWPWANVGIVTGRISGLLVLDIDGPVGEESLGNLELPPTVIVETGGGGWHHYFKYPEGGNVGNKTELFHKVDIRGNGGYVVAPPSKHISGKQYRWAQGATPGDMGVSYAE